MEQENNYKIIEFDSEVLREYDIRGIVDQNITEDTAYTIGRVFGYVVFETIKNRFGKQFMDSTYVTEKVIESQKESKGTGSWFIFHYLNGKCPYCKNNFLSEHISKKHSASDKILRCSKCKALCVKTFPDKWIFSPSYVAGGIVFLSELAGEHEIELIVGSFLLSFILSSILTKFWINEKYIEN